MAGNLLDLINPTALNMLLRPQQMAGAPNMLMSRPDPQNYPIAPVQAPMAAPAPQMAQPQADPWQGMREANAGPATAEGFLGKMGLSQDRKDMLFNAFLGLAKGNTLQDSLYYGAAMGHDSRQLIQNKNKTVEWLRGRGMDEQNANLLARNPTALADYLKSLYQGKKEDELINAGGSLYNKTTGEWIQPPAGSARQTEYGLNLIYGQDQNGNTVAFQPSKDGTYKPFVPPAGVELTPGITSSDLGTSIITRNNKTGQIIDTQEKDVLGTEAQKGRGQALSEAQVALPGIETSAKYAMDTIDSLSNDPYLPNMLGPFDSRTPNLTTDAARVQGYMNQLKGQAFLQAFNSLKGGGAITEIEGQKAEQAIARLDAAQSETDYKKALGELRSIMDQGLQNARKKAGALAAPAATAPASEPNVDDLLRKYGG